MEVMGPEVNTAQCENFLVPPDFGAWMQTLLNIDVVQ